MSRQFKFLHLEDSRNDAELIQERIASEGIEGEIVLVDTKEDFVAALEQSGFDLILADYSLPLFDGMAALTIAQEVCPEVPFIFVSGVIGEERAIEALKSGATDYVLKDRLSRLAPAVRRALEEMREKTERKKAEAEKERLIIELQDALAKVKQLSGMLPICAYCKKIRDDKGYWDDVALFITRHSDAVFSHGLCPDCEKKEYEKLEKVMNGK